MKVLSIGNSFSDNATQHIADIIATEKDLDLTFAAASLGGCSLEKHWNLVEQCDILPDVKPYRFRVVGTKESGDLEVEHHSLKEILVKHKWDFVTLQQVSHCSWRKETYTPYIENLHKLVTELAPQAKIVLHQTWAYRNDDEKYFSENDLTQEKMQEAIIKNINAFAKQFDCKVLPSGEAISRTRAKMGFTPDTTFDYDNPIPPNLPKEDKSLSVGYIWRTGNTPSGKAELVLDSRHLNIKGRYIANAVWFEMFSGRSILENTFKPDEISDDELQLFKTIAHQTVVDYGGALV